MTFLFLMLPLLAGEVDWSLNLDSYGAWEKQPIFDQGGSTLLQRLRINAGGDLSERWNWDFAYELNAIYKQDLFAFFPQVYLRRENLKHTPHLDKDGALLQQIDRLALSYEAGRSGLTLGRQAVGHGNGRFFTPSDIFAPITTTTLNAQYKSGIDGIRFVQGYAEEREWGILAFIPEEGPGLYLAQLAWVLGNVDLSFLAGESYGEPTFAWDLATSWKGAALYCEGVWRQGENRDNPIRAMLGLSRRIGEKWDLTIETQYNSLGVDTPLRVLAIPEWQHGELTWVNKHHVATALDVELKPLIRLSSAVIAETNSGSAWFQLAFLWDLSERTTFSVGGLVTQGLESEEFGRYSDTLFMEYRLTLP